MTTARDVWAVVPVKETGAAKQRLADILSSAQRRELALAMLEDVLSALTAVPALGGILVVTLDEAATALAVRYGARILTDGARDGHTGAVTAGASHLAKQSLNMLALPADIPLVQAADIEAILAAHDTVPGFTIVPASDALGSNAILCSPPDAVPLRFGEDSYFPHLAAARSRGIEPRTIHLPRIGLDIDRPDDLRQFIAVPSPTRAYAVLARHGIAQEAVRG